MIKNEKFLTTLELKKIALRQKGWYWFSLVIIIHSCLMLLIYIFQI